MVEHRCLRCGALVGGTEPAVSTVHGPVAPDPEPDALLPRPAQPPATSEPAANGSSERNGDEHDDDDAPLAALTALRELGDLHASGVLTDAEFAAKKAELLRRV